MLIFVDIIHPISLERMFIRTQEKIIGFNIISRMSKESLAFRLKYCDIQFLHDLFGNLGLDHKDIFEGSVIALRPNMNII